MPTKEKSFSDIFRLFSRKVSKVTGSFWTFLLSVLIIFVWILTGPYFNYSDTWQLVINTGTTIVTFLMVFIIQNTQNRDGKALQLKLDELIKASRASNLTIDLENMSDRELKDIESQYAKIYENAVKLQLNKSNKDRVKQKDKIKQVSTIV